MEILSVNLLVFLAWVCWLGTIFQSLESKPSHRESIDLGWWLHGSIHYNESNWKSVAASFHWKLFSAVMAIGQPQSDHQTLMTVITTWKEGISGVNMVCKTSLGNIFIEILNYFSLNFKFELTIKRVQFANRPQEVANCLFLMKKSLKKSFALKIFAFEFFKFVS